MIRECLIMDLITKCFEVSLAHESFCNQNLANAWVFKGILEDNADFL